MADKFMGTWKLETTENFDEYMKAVEVGFMMRKMGAVAKPNVIISQDSDTWTVRSETSFTTNENKFQLGKQFEETTADGRKVMTTYNIQDNKLVQEQTGKVPSTITREIAADGTMIVTCVAKDVTCKRTYSKAAA